LQFPTASLQQNEEVCVFLRSFIKNYLSYV